MKGGLLTNNFSSVDAVLRERQRLTNSYDYVLRLGRHCFFGVGDYSEKNVSFLATNASNDCPCFVTMSRAHDTNTV